MTYPRNPAGLNRNEHYMMANQVYYAWAGAQAVGRTVSTQSEPDPAPEDGTPACKHGRHERTYKSIYKGVTVHNGRYVSQWKQYNRSYKGGSIHPLTQEGARQAAVDRAIALGLDYLERRDGNHEPLH